MPRVAMYNVNGEQVGELELNDHIFNAPVHTSILHLSVVKHLAGRRLGTHDTRTRGEVRGGGRKPWRQKGTGRARHGSIRSPIWRGGGIIFGPHPRDYSFTLPKKARRLALRSAFSSKVKGSKFLVLNDLKMERPKTKDILEILNNLKVKNALLVTRERDENIFKSVRNLPCIKSVSVEGLNVYDILAYDTLVITRDALARVEEAFLK